MNEHFNVEMTVEFERWLRELADPMTRARLVSRLDRARRGLLGDVKALGDQLFEMRESFGPGWRMYFTRSDRTLIIFLAGGNKSSQSSDIAKARLMAEQISRGKR